MIATHTAQLAVELPDSPYRMWIDGTLDDHLPLPEIYRAEIIGGRIVLSRAEPFRHAWIVTRIIGAVSSSSHLEVVAHTGLDLADIQDAYIPDLVLLDREHADRLARQGVPYLRPADVPVVVEITSKTSARHDRVRPVSVDGACSGGKAMGYARCAVPFYLVVDCDPEVASIMLYSQPDSAAGTYLGVVTRPLGEPIQLPDLIGLTIPTDQWRTWT